MSLQLSCLLEKLFKSTRLSVDHIHLLKSYGFSNLKENYCVAWVFYIICIRTCFDLFKCESFLGLEDINGQIYR